MVRYGAPLHQVPRVCGRIVGVDVTVDFGHVVAADEGEGVGVGHGGREANLVGKGGALKYVEGDNVVSRKS